MKELKIGIYSIPPLFYQLRCNEEFFSLLSRDLRCGAETRIAVKLILNIYLMLNLLGFHHGNLGVE